MIASKKNLQASMEEPEKQLRLVVGLKAEVRENILTKIYWM